MARTTIVIAAALALAVTHLAAPAQAQAARTFVSAAGSDSNNCTNVATPCRHFATAFAATNTNGEIYVLDPANYGSLTITHGVSIEGHGWASIAPVTGSAAITINANPGDKINIIGVVLDGTAITNTTGIVFSSGGSLTIQDSIVRNFSGSGIALAPTTSATITVSRTLVAENGGHGIFLQPSGSPTVHAVFNRVEAYHNAQKGIGIFSNIDGTNLDAIIVDSVAAYNADGFYALGSDDLGLLSVIVRVNRSTTYSNNVAGLHAEAHAVMYVSQTDLNEYQSAWVEDSSSCIFTYGDNYTYNNPRLCTAFPVYQKY